MSSFVFLCPKCRHRHGKPGKCDKDGSEFVKVCSHCEHPLDQCICN